MKNTDPREGDFLPDPEEKYYDARQFLLLTENRVFINSAYACILKRFPDQEGYNSYHARLEKGGFRQQVLVELLLSEEARPHAVTLTHLRTFLAWPKLQAHAPLAARLLAPAFGLLKSSLNRIQYYQARQRRAQFSRERKIKADVREIRETLEPVMHRVETLEQQNAAFRSQIRLMKNQFSGRRIDPESFRSADPAGEDSEALQKERQADFNDFYLDFEIAFRGSREAIRERLAHYLSVLPDAASGAARVVDLGCGRGEWLAMLQATGYSARGLDSSPVMRQICRDQGLSVSGEPMHRWLRDQPDASLCAVTAFHLAEHLPFEYLLALVMEAKRLLQPGGVLILETQNPESLRVSAYAFYHDPTHRNPLTPELLEFMANYAGFEPVRLQRLSQVPENLHIREKTETAVAFDQLLNAPRDLALIAFQPFSA